MQTPLWVGLQPDSLGFSPTGCCNKPWVGLQPDGMLQQAVGRASAQRGLCRCGELRRPEGRPTTPPLWVGLQPDGMLQQAVGRAS
ncbi:MAG TPA: hypothetical protein PKI24_22455, partial [Nitrospira sp.]|nr:hypothetical protein [Nitrospira sp.]